MDKKIEKLTLEDGRWAERHVYFDDNGNEIIELYEEPKKTLNLNKRIVNVKKEVLAEQRIETVKDGEVVEVEVLSTEPGNKMELREHIRKLEDKKEDETAALLKSLLEKLDKDKTVLTAQNVKPAQEIVKEKIESNNNFSPLFWLIVLMNIAAMGYYFIG